MVSGSRFLVLMIWAWVWFLMVLRRASRAEGNGKCVWHFRRSLMRCEGGAG